MAEQGVPPLGERVYVKLVRNGKVIYDSSKSTPMFAADVQPLKYCLSCGAEVIPVIFGCTNPKCGKRYVSQLEVNSGKRLILALEPTPGAPSDE
jgi:hypothetical protein